MNMTAKTGIQEKKETAASEKDTGKFDMDVGKPAHLTINVEKNMKRSVVNTNEKLKELDIVLEEYSKLDYLEIMNSDSEMDVVKRIIVKRNAELTIHKIVVGSKNKLSHTTIELWENSTLKVMNLFLASGQKQEHEMTIIHKGRGSHSELYNKGLLSSADMMLTGLIRIERFAEESVGIQKSDMLILKDSKAISLPNLEIQNNNVVCNHSASITRIDEEKLFYLQSRGIDLLEAKEMMINSFIHKTLEDLSENKKERIMPMLQEKVSKMMAE
jgi:Fe-S cluster assembly scaffold protein SufB